MHYSDEQKRRTAQDIRLKSTLQLETRLKEIGDFSICQLDYDAGKWMQRGGTIRASVAVAIARALLEYAEAEMRADEIDASVGKR